MVTLGLIGCLQYLAQYPDISIELDMVWATTETEINKLRNAAQINNILYDVCVQCGQQQRIFVIVQSPEHCPHQNMKIFQY